MFISVVFLVLCGIALEDVNLVKAFVDNKCKDKTLFVTEGLCAVEKHNFKNVIKKNAQKQGKITNYYFLG